MLSKFNSFPIRLKSIGILVFNGLICFTNVFAAEIADLILQNGKIYTVNEAQPWAEAIAIKNGQIVFVGANSEINNYKGPQTTLIELGGRMVLPGFHDSHLHPLEAGSEVGTTCDIMGITHPNQIIKTLQACAPNQIGTDWILGGGHAIGTLFELLDNGQLPINILDEAIPDKPVALLEETSHSLWINSIAWAQAVTAYGFDDNTSEVPGGIIYRDEKGDFTGILFENTGNMVLDLAFTRSESMDQLTYEGLLYGLKILAQNGITSITDARTYWKRGHLEAWQKAKREGQLTTRAVLGLWAYPHSNDDEQIAQLISLYNYDPKSLLQISQVKIYSDGIIGNGTAALLEPYQISFDLTSENKGLNYFNEERLTRYMTELERAGFDLHIHTIGDRAVREALNAIEAAQKTNGELNDRRHRLTHLELVDVKDRPRFAQLGVIADFQLAGEFTEPKHAKVENQPLIGQRTVDMFPVRSLYDSGAKITLSSDWDVSEPSPFLGIECAVTTGKLPNLETAIQAYTINAAFLMRQEKVTGSIEVGKYADLVVLDQNLFEIPVNKISKTKVLLTLLAGQEVYRHANFANSASCLPANFDFATYLLHLPEVNTDNLGTYAVNMGLLGFEPPMLELRSATPIIASKNSCVANFDGTILHIPRVSISEQVFLASLVRENSNEFIFILSEELKLIE
jgi:hypothetical protein